jgi:uncharacterized protein
MPITTTYPGVYIEEIPSGVRTITGVSTSVAAFVGAAKRGPIGKPSDLYAFADYERLFGGLDPSSEMSYAVRQFFLNGGQKAWVVRAAPGASPATLTLQTTTPGPHDALVLTSALGGSSGNTLVAAVDYDTNVPASTFNLTLSYPSLDDPQNALAETFTNLSMNPADPRYAPTVVSATSKLVSAVQIPPGLAVAVPLTAATSVSGILVASDVAASIAVGATRTFRVAVNADPPVLVTLDNTDVATANPLHSVAQKIQATVQVQGFSCTVAASGNQLELKLAPPSANGDSLRVLPGPVNDISATLRLGSLNGGVERDSFADRRPALVLPSGTVFGGEIDSTDAGFAALANHTFTIKLDGDATAHTVTIGDHTAIADFGGKLNAIAQEITTQVQQAATTPALSGAYARFTATVTRTNSLRLRSGSTGPGSAVGLTAGVPNDALAPLKLDAAVVNAPGQVATFSGGTEIPPPWTDPQTVDAILGPTVSAGQGLYALDTTDFNLLVLAGVTNDAITAAAAAFVQDHRAFYILDPPPGRSPDDMATYMSGPHPPKTEYGAMYYPYIKIADPLAGGALRTTAPSGTIAGVYARTDASRGVWKAPAGTDAVLAGASDLETVMNDGQNGSLNPLGLNAIRSFPVYGIVSWGARTLRGADAAASEYKYVPVRRLALYIEESLFRGTKWVVFEPNDEPLWAQIRLNVGAFMQGLFRQGAFQGSTPRQAYFVKCDSSTTVQNDINLGVVNIVVGFAPLKPAEFVVIQIQQIAGQLTA